MRQISTLFPTFLLLLTLRLAAQPTSCNTFDDLVPGTFFYPEEGYEAGDLLTEGAGHFPTLLGDYLNANGNTSLSGVVVFENTNNGTPQLFLNEATIDLPFHESPAYLGASQVCFEYSYSGLGVNFGIDGEVHHYEDFSDPQIAEDFPNIDISVVGDPAFGATTSICLAGEIGTLTLGGIEQAIDNLCYTLICNDLALEQLHFRLDCSGPDEYLLLIEPPNLPLSDVSFQLFLNDAYYDTIPVEELPQSIALPYTPDAPEELQLSVWLNDNPNCVRTKSLTVPRCYTEGCLGLEVYTDQMAESWAAGWPVESTYYTEQGVRFTLLPAILNGDPFYGDAPFFRFSSVESTIDPPFTTAQGIFFGQEGSTSLINLHDYPGTVTEVTLDFYRPGTPNNVINIDVNGQELLELYPTGGNSPYTHTFEDGSVVEISFSPDNPKLGVMHFSGENLESIRLGGESLYFDNLCLVNSCTFGNLVASQLPCDGNTGPYPVALNFTRDGIVSDTFLVRNGAGDTLGVFTYGELPIVEILVDGEPGDTVQLTIAEWNEPTCETSTTLYLSDCEGLCSQYGAAFAGYDCENTETIHLSLQTNIPPLWQQLTLTGQGSGYVASTLYFSDQGPSFEWPTEVPESNFVLYDPLLDCEFNLVLPSGWELESCQNCEIYDLVAEPTECTPDGFYSVWVDFGYDYNTGSFMVLVNNDWYGPFERSEFPVEVGELDGANPQTVYVEVMEANGGCAIGTTFTHDCTFNCANFEVDLLEIICSDSDLIAIVKLGPTVAPEGQTIFIYNPETGEQRSVVYEEYPLYVEWPANEPAGLWIIQDLSTDCTTELFYTGYEDPCGFSCELGPLDLLAECRNDGTYDIEVDFAYQNVTDDHFDLYINDEFVGFFSLDALPLTLEGFAPTVEDLIVTVCINDNGDCCFEDVLTLPDCTPECDVYDIEVYGSECDNQGNYAVSVHFESMANALFDVWNQTTGQRDTISLEEVPYTFDEQNIADIQSTAIRIAAIGFPGCVAEPLYVHECEGGDCQLGPLDLLAECQNNGTYDIEINFEYENVGNEFFDLYINQEFVGFFPFDALPLTLEGQELEGDLALVKVCVNDIADCCRQDDVALPNCNPNNSCAFNDVIVEAYDCDGDEFMVDIAFNNPQGGPLGFYIFGDGMIFGPFTYGEEYYTFGPLNGSNGTHDILLIDIANPACFGAYSLDHGCSDDCDIMEVVATPTPCDGGEFWVELDVEANNTADLFSVVGNGDNYGTFAYADLPITLGPFAGDAETVYEFGVIDLGHPNCTSWTEIAPVDCLPCDIRDLVYEVECGDDFYNLTIDFIHENTDSDFFVLQIGGEFYGEYPYEALPLTVDVALAVTGETIRVEDGATEACGETVDFFVPCCALYPEAETITAGDCQNDGTFYIALGTIDGANLGDSLLVQYAPAGSTLFESVTLAYDDLPAEVGPVAGNGTTTYYVIVTDQEFGCSFNKTVEPVSCDNNACVEFDELEGIFSPATGYANGAEIGSENGVTFTYEEHPTADCPCTIFGLDAGGLAAVDFGSGQVVALQTAGIGLHLLEVEPYESFTLAYYLENGELTLQLDNANAVTVSNVQELPSNIAPGVTLTVTPDPGSGQTGTLTFTGLVEHLYLYASGNAAFDDLCFTPFPEDDLNVWPGDTNHDNVAGHVDLLNIGLAYGMTGPSRPNVNTEWAALEATNWAQTFANGLNHKHADANGDGEVDVEDRAVIQQNYNLTHGPVGDFEELPGTDIDPPAFVDLTGIEELPNGSSFQIPVVIGTAEQEVDDVYGIAFTIELDPEVIDLSSVTISYPTSWMGEPDVNLITLHKLHDNGRLEVALTRIDHNNVSGHGTVLYIGGIIDDIAGLHAAEYQLHEVLALDHNELRKAFRTPTSLMTITNTKEPIDRRMLRETFEVYPNPTADLVWLRNLYNLPPNRVELYSSASELLAIFEDPGTSLSLGHLPAGVYLLRVHVYGEIITKRVVRMFP